MKRPLGRTAWKVVLLLVVGTVLRSHAGGTLNLYVATDGCDTWSGRSPDPDAANQNGPFATLERARDEIRSRREQAGLREGVVVNVRAGTYCLDRTFSLTAADAGTAEAPIVYRGYGVERPLLIGGKPVTGFAPHQDQILVADMAEPGLKGIAFRQLLFDGQRQILARYPNVDPKEPYAGGWSYVDGEAVEMYRDFPEDSRRLLPYRAEDAHRWAGAEVTAGEICIFPRFNWWNNIVPLAAIDRENRLLTLARDCSYAIRPGDRYYVRGFLEELDAPGEWYLDRVGGTLYFWPPAPSPGKTVFAPTLRTIVEFGTGAAWNTLRGFDLTCAEGDAVVMNEATNCLVAGCRIQHVGDYDGSGVVIRDGTGNGVVGCDIFDVGHSGVVISGGDRPTLTPAGNYADNNYIHHVGVFYKQGVGVSLRGVGNRASHNLIHDGPRMGILFSGNNLIIEYNHIRHTNLETEDTGAVYTGGRDWISSRGTVIRYNYFHDMLGFGRKDGRWVSPYFAWGIYLDDNAGGVDVIGNLVARCSRAGLHLHNARDTLIANNVFIDNGQYQVEYSGWTERSGIWREHFPTMVAGFESVSTQPAWQHMRNMQTHPRDAVLPDGSIMSGNTLTRNIFYGRDPAARLYRFSNVSFAHNTADRNLAWQDTVWTDDVHLHAVEALDEWQSLQALGVDVNSRVADPRFVAPERDDWRLSADSPAFALGFQPIPVDKIGPYEDPLRCTWPIMEAAGAREWLADRARREVRHGASRFIRQLHLFPGLVAVVAEGDLEPRSIGSYAVRLYDSHQTEHPTDGFIDGIVEPRTGAVVDAAVVDLDRDGRGEIVITIRNVGTGGYLSADAFRVDGRRLIRVGRVADLPKDADCVSALIRSLATGAASPADAHGQPGSGQGGRYQPRDGV